MFSNRIVQVFTKDIIIDREIRQRTNLTHDSVIDLAYAIGTSQWICPLLVDQDSNSIVAGERRLTAVKVLENAMNGDYSAFDNPEEARIKLAHVCTCKVSSWNNWTKVPTQLGSNLTEQELAVYELIENMHRKDLSWQDKAKAIYSVHAHGLATNTKWSNVKTGMLIGTTSSTVTKNLRVWRFMEDETTVPEIQTIITGANTLLSASQNIDKYVSRRSDNIVALTSRAIAPRAETNTNTDIAIKSGPKNNKQFSTESIDIDDFPEDSDFIKDPVSIGNKLLINTTFHEGAEKYSGPPFNFIQCDFPYGISFNKGSQGSTIASAIKSDYDDSADIYWGLLITLAEYQDKLIAPSAHILFWFSQNLYEETKAFFTAHFPQAVIQSHLMVWHCSDNSGIIPDSQRYGRRTYETAMLITFGDRLISIPRALSFSASRETNSRIHRSQKPLPVLEHFLSMFVDEASIVLDPTAGSGTSLIAAYKLKAKSIVGFECNPEAHTKAVEYIDNELNKEDILL